MKYKDKKNDMFKWMSVQALLQRRTFCTVSPFAVATKRDHRMLHRYKFTWLPFEVRQLLI